MGNLGNLDSIQHILVKFTYNSKQFIISAKYARYSSLERLELWDELQSLRSACDMPRIIGRAFHVIFNEDEKLGGLAFEQQEAMDFDCFINNNSLTWSSSLEIVTHGGMEGLKQNVYSNNLRVLVNDIFIELFPSYEVQHLLRQGSNHAPLHLQCNTDEEVIIKPFRFLNFWTNHQLRTL